MIFYYIDEDDLAVREMIIHQEILNLESLECELEELYPLGWWYEQDEADSVLEDLKRISK